MFKLTGKVALITGGSKGIGFGMARALGKQGAKIAIASRGMDDLHSAKEKLIQEDIDTEAFQVDVSQKHQVEQLMEDVVNHFGSVDILVNNAGMNIRKRLVDVEEEDWDKVINTNLKGIFLAGQAAAKRMLEQGGGKIINISSIMGGIGSSFQSSYAASKGGINQLTRVWADELSQHGITVNAIAPAYIRTPMTENWLSDEERLAGIINSTMSKRVGEVEDLDGPVVFLAANESDYITGQILYVDGGWTAR